jgi:hypothetical protein
MFARLIRAMPPSGVAGPSDAGTPAEGVRSAVGDLAGTTLANGLYRLHTASSAAMADLMVLEAFPEFAGRVECFGFDWLGRQFSLDRTRGVSGDPDVLLFDVGAGEALEIPVAFSRLHDEELVDYSDAALASHFFAEWFQSHPEPIAFDACVGYRVPLFMGGGDTLPNLEISDLDVYWSLTGQLRLAAAGS